MGARLLAKHLPTSLLYSAQNSSSCWGVGVRSPSSLEKSYVRMRVILRRSTYIVRLVSKSRKSFAHEKLSIALSTAAGRDGPFLKTSCLYSKSLSRTARDVSNIPCCSAPSIKRPSSPGSGNHSDNGGSENEESSAGSSSQSSSSSLLSLSGHGSA